nr:DUF664 domain-containing protein [Amycolatopsis umgeniensis]
MDRRTHQTIERFRRDLGHYTPLTQQGVMLHVLEEVAQHHGQLEITRDVLLAG